MQWTFPQTHSNWKSWFHYNGALMILSHNVIMWCHFSKDDQHIDPLICTTAPVPTRTTRTPAFWDTRLCFMITHTSDSHQIPSQNKTKSNFGILQETLHTTHLLKLLNKMYEYQMDPTKTVGATEQTRDAGRKDGRTDGVKPIYPPNNFVALRV